MFNIYITCSKVVLRSVCKEENLSTSVVDTSGSARHRPDRDAWHPQNPRSFFFRSPWIETTTKNDSEEAGLDKCIKRCVLKNTEH